MSDTAVNSNEVVPNPVPKVAETDSRSSFLSGIQYLYFLRFSLLLLISTPVLVLVDRFTGANSITRGIFMPAASYDFIEEAFFLVCAGMIALITSRLVVLNGEDRYGVKPPLWLSKSLGSESDGCAGGVLFFYQLPGLGALGYLLWISRIEVAPYPQIQAALMGLVGIAIAFIFWGSLNIIYYWTAKDGTNYPPRTILLPRRCFGLAPFKEAKIEAVLKPPLFVSNGWNQLAKLGPGYSSNRSQLYSGHQFAVIAAIGYLLIYLFLFPLTSPFTAGIGYIISLCCFAAVTLALAVLSFSLKPPCIKWAKYLIGAEFLLLSIGAVGLLFGFVKASQTFPVLCSVLVLLTLLALLVCALAFLLDRFHIPVILVTLALVLVFHAGTALLYLLPGFNQSARFRGFSDHYFEVLDQKHSPQLVSPMEIVKGRTCGPSSTPVPCPIILVSATGGGIHAAAWTTEMLTELEGAFQKNPSLAQAGYTFHNNVALFSTVSGGSVGLLPFLNEYYADKPFAPDEWENRKDRMFAASTCSSLEAVAWGLEYRDFDTFLVPWISGLFSPKWDRSVALEASFHRHLFEAPCRSLDPDDPGKVTDVEPLTKNEKTLGDFADDLRNWVDHRNQQPVRYVPAFSMNTTAAETGGRFLLSDYHVTPNVENDAGVAPAEDFLFAYGGRQGRQIHPNIRLTTAARLSATFPYVSSAARSDQMRDDAGTLHFVDGGYYDNDGIATVAEFLLASQPALGGAVTSDGKVLSTPILLIEIRDGSDVDVNSPEGGANAPTKPGDKPPFVWNTSKQLSAPLGAFWSAGHEAVSRRNRRELEVLMNLLASKHVIFDHIVLDYKDDSMAEKQGASQPLSWFLTPYQVSRIRAAESRVAPCMTVASGWVASALSEKDIPSLTSHAAVSHCAKE